MSIINLIENNINNVIHIRIAKQKDGVFDGWHRCTIAPGDDYKSIFTAINVDLVRMGYDPVVDLTDVEIAIQKYHILNA